MEQKERDGDRNKEQPVTQNGIRLWQVPRLSFKSQIQRDLIIMRQLLPIQY